MAATNALAGLGFTVSTTKTETPSNLIKLIKANGGQGSLMFSPKFNYVISTLEEVKSGSFKLKRALEENTPIVSEDFVFECVKAGKVLDDAPFRLSADSLDTKKESMFEYESNFVADAELQQAQLQQKMKEQVALAKINQTPAQAPQATSAASAPKPSAPVDNSFSFGSGAAPPTSSSFSFGTGYAPASALEASVTGYDANTNSVPLAEREIATPSTLPPGITNSTRAPPTKIQGVVPKVKAWKDKAADKPYFPASFTIDCYETLQWFDIEHNHNKYYVLELHRAEERGKPYFRLYSHYGRNDDLAKNPESGQRENRFYATLLDAENAFVSIIQEKTLTKGYRKVALVFSNVGSHALQALLKHAAELEAQSKIGSHESKIPKLLPETNLGEEVKSLVEYIYAEASKALSSTLGPADITEHGIKTPLGVIGMAQIERGEAILQKLYELFKLGDESNSSHQQNVKSLSNEFYTTIPHSVGGRDREQISKALINNMRMFEEKQELLQLMKDMLHVAQETRSTLGTKLTAIDMKYIALGARINFLQPDSDQFKHMSEYIMENQVGEDRNQVKIKNIFAVQRPEEWEAFSKCHVPHNHRLLFHGSRVSNYVGLLSRGVLMPKMVVAMGGKRRDAGLLGHGIYFGDSVTTSAQYTSLGSTNPNRKTRLMLINNVALGTVKDYTKVMFGLTEAPEGFHSVHGVRKTEERDSEFKDDEYVIFNTNQQQQEYLVEFVMTTDESSGSTSSTPISSMPTSPAVQPVSSSSASTSTFSEPSPAEERKAELESSDSIFKWPTAEPTTKVESKLSASNRKNKLWTSSSSNPVGGTSAAPLAAAAAATTTSSTSSSGTSLLSTGGLQTAGLLDTSLKLQTSGLQTSGLTVNVPTGIRKSQQGTSSSYRFGVSSVAESPKKAKLAQPTTAPSVGTGYTSYYAADSLASTSSNDTGAVQDDDSETSSTDGRRGLKRDSSTAASSDTTSLLPPKKQKLRLSSEVNTTSNSAPLSSFALRTSGGGLVMAKSDMDTANDTNSLRLSGGSSSSSSASQSAVLVSQAASAAKNAIAGLRNKLVPGAPLSKMQSMIGKDNTKLKTKEDKLRELFVKDRSNFAIADPKAHLIDVYKNVDQFVQCQEADEEIAIPKLLTKLRLTTRSNQTAVQSSFEDFQDEFKAFTNGVFEGFDWKNVVVAGGAVLAALLKLDEKDKVRFRDSDVDLFICGLSEDAAAQRVKDIFFQIQSRTDAACEIIRSKHAVTILCQFPNRHVQVVLRLYKSPAEVLMGFDIDCCCVAYDGSSVMALPRGHRAITKRYNLVDMSRRSLTYETRLYKYAKRGFAIAVPGLQRHLVEPSIFSKRPWQVQGLAKLLVFEHEMNTRPPRSSRTDAQAIWRPQRPRQQRYEVYAKDEFTEDRINEFEAAEYSKSDYSNVFIPWGPQWKLSKILKHLEHRDKAFFFSSKITAARRHVFFQGLDGVIQGKPPAWDKSSLALSTTTDVVSTGHYVEGPLKWIDDNPGRQILSGSFHPVDDDTWYNDCYTNDAQRELTQHLVDASFGNKMELLNTLVRKAGRQLDANAVDMFPEGRSALGYAALLGHYDVARLLLDKGASATAMEASTGFQPIHYAAYSGNTLVFELLVQRGARVGAATREQNWTPLHFASYYHHMDLLKVLLNEHTANIDVNAADVQNRTPMFVAAMAGHVDVMQLLKDAGAKLEIKDKSLVGPLDIAAQLGQREAATWLISILKPEHPPVIRAAPTMIASAQTTGKDSEQPASAGGLFVSEQVTQDIWHAHDAAGQTILHYAVKAGEVYLVKKLLQARIKSGAEVEARAFRGIKFDVIDNAGWKHVDIDAENIFGQTPLYYVMQLLSTVVLPGGPLPLGDSKNLFGLPSHELLKNWLLIRELLVAAGAQAPHLIFHRDLPDVKDDSLSNLLTRQATHAKAEWARMEAYEAELERQALEQERLEQQKKQEEQRKAYGTTSKKRRAPESPPRVDAPTAALSSPFGEHKSTKTTSAVFSAGYSTSSSLSSANNKYSEIITPKAPLEPIVPFKPPVEETPDTTPQPVSLSSAPTFSSLGASTMILSAFGGGSSGGSAFSSATSASLSAFGGSALSASSMMIGATPAKPAGAGARTAGAAGPAPAKSVSVLKTDIAQLLVAVIDMSKANMISVAEKAVLKTLALQRDRHMIAALRAFQLDADLDEFRDTLKKIYTQKTSPPLVFTH